MKNYKPKSFILHGCPQGGKTLFYDKVETKNNMLLLDFRFLQLINKSPKKLDNVKNIIGLEETLKLIIKSKYHFYTDKKNILSLYKKLRNNFPDKNIISINGFIKWFRYKDYRDNEIIKLVLFRDPRINWITHIIDPSDMVDLKTFIRQHKRFIRLYKLYSEYMIRVDIGNINKTMSKFNIISSSITENQTTIFDHINMIRLTEDVEKRLKNELLIINSKLSNELEFLGYKKNFTMKDFYNIVKKDKLLIKKG